MAFCAYCGKQIPDGQLCDCAESRAAQGAGGLQQGMPMGNVNGQPQMNPGMNYKAQQDLYQEQARQAAAQATQSATQAASKAGNILNETFGYLLLILKAPATAGSNFVAAAGTKAACAMVLLQAVAAGLFSLLIANKLNGLLGGLAGLAGGSMGGMLGSVVPDVISVGKAFFITMLMSIVFALIFALLSWGVALLSKGRTNFRQMIAVSGARSAFLIPITVVSILLFFLNPFIGIAVFMICGPLFSMASQMESMHGVAGMNHNTKVYLVVLATMIFSVVVLILAIQAMPQTISGIYRKALEVGGGLSGLDFEDLLDLLDDLIY